MATLAQLRTAIRLQIDEPTARFWTDADLNQWINDGLKDIARRTETIQSYNTSVSAVVGTAKYAFPTDLIRVHRVEFTPTGQTTTYTLEAKTQDEMDRIWFGDQTSQSSYPSYFMIWGFPGGTGTMEHKFQVWPVPSQTGTFNIYYYRVPTALSADGDVAQVPSGWEDLLTFYCMYRALLKKLDPTFQAAKALYDEQIMYMIDTTRAWHDQNQAIMRNGVAIPSYLHSGGDW